MSYILLDAIKINGQPVEFESASIEVTEYSGLKSWSVDISFTDTVIPFDSRSLNFDAKDTQGNEYSGNVITTRQDINNNGNHIELEGSGPLHGYLSR